MLKVLLVRPGATEFDQQGRIQGTLDIPLCEDGRKQTRDSLADLVAQSPEFVYTSPCEAAQQTGELIATAAGVKQKAMPKLANLDHGLWQGMLVEEVREKQPKVYRQWQDHPETICPPDGETIGDAKTRVTDVLRRLQKKHKEGTIALVVPEPLTSVVRHVLNQNELTDLWQGSERCGQWEAIDVPGEVAVGAA